MFINVRPACRWVNIKADIHPQKCVKMANLDIVSTERLDRLLAKTKILGQRSDAVNNSVDSKQHRSRRGDCDEVGYKQCCHRGFVAKTLHQPHPTEVGDMGFVEGKTDFLGAFWHDTQNALLGSFV